MRIIGFPACLGVGKVEHGIVYEGGGDGCVGFIAEEEHVDLASANVASVRVNPCNGGVVDDVIELDVVFDVFDFRPPLVFN